MEKQNYLENILEEDEIKDISLTTKKKIEIYIQDKIEELLTSKALFSTKIQNAENQVKSLKELEVQMNGENEQLKKKINNLETLQKDFECNNNYIKAENEKLKLELSVFELQHKSAKKECEQLLIEKEQLSQMIDRRNSEIERLKIEVKEFEIKLKDNLSAKCEALIKLDSCSTKEASLDLKTKIFEQEKALLQNQIKSLKIDLERNMNELANVRREHTMNVMTFETKLFEKIEELKLSKSINSQLEKANESLSIKAEDLSIRIKTDAEETHKLIEHYEKELQSQKKLVMLYKDSVEENTKQINEMAKSIKELQMLLHEATDEYGVLENKLKQQELKYQDELNQKENAIKELNEKISKVEILNEEIDISLNDHAMNFISPSAASLKKLKEEGLSIPSLYSAYAKASNELHEKKLENEKLQLQLKHVLNEIEKRAPDLKRQVLEHNHLVETNSFLTEQIETMQNAFKDVESKLEGLNAKCGFLQRENQKLRTERGDLARQVCHLLHKIDENGNQDVEPNNIVTNDMTSNEVITKKLVTFSNIEELQENNTKLLLLVRDLSSKLEEMEENIQSGNNENLDAKIRVYTQKIEELKYSQKTQTELIEKCMKQRDRFKELYLESVQGRSSTNIDLSNIPNDISCSKKDSDLQTKVDEYVKIIAEKDKELVEMKESFNKYKTEKSINEKINTEQIENMREEVRNLTSKNYKIASAIEFKTEQLKINNQTMQMYKKQISSLEERNKNYEITISRHESSLKSLTEELLKHQNQLSRAEINCEHLQQEVQRLRELEIRYLSENEFFKKEQQTQSLLLQNLETIKSNIQKSEVEGKQKLEVNLSDLNRECAALRRRLQEEEDRFRSVLTDAENEKKELQRSINEKDKILNDIKNKFNSLEKEITEKNMELIEIKKRYDNVSANQPLREKDINNLALQKMIEELKLENSSLKQEIFMIREHAHQYSLIAENYEKDLKYKTQDYENVKVQLQDEIRALKHKESTLIEKIDAMERDLLIKSSSIQTFSNENEELMRLKTDLTEALSQLKEMKSESMNLKTRNMQLSEDLRNAEQKYANEMILHSGDIQALASLKEEYQKLVDEYNNIRCSKESTNEMLARYQESLLSIENNNKTEKQELETRIKDLETHNSILHQQIESLGAKLAAFTNQNDDALQYDDDSKSSDELLQIIKFLRKEKDLSKAKLESLNNEHVRVKTEKQLLENKIKKLEQKSKETPSESQMMIASTLKHEELLRKLETINAITDSNRILREERDILASQIKDLQERMNKLNNEILPLKEKDTEQSMKLDSLSVENAALKIEATRWKQRVNILVERSNKANPEDVKRLQQDKENLSRSLINEKEESKKLLDEVTQYKSEAIRFEAEISNLKKTNQTLIEEINKLQVDISLYKENISKITADLNEANLLKNQYKQDIEKLNIELTEKDSQLNDTKNKEIQIRKIAKRYKDSYLELQKQQESKEETSELQSNQQDSSINTMELNALTEENNSLKKQMEELKISLEKEERNKNLLREAKQRIVCLNETKQNLSKELEMLKTKISTMEQSKPESDSKQASEVEVLVQKTKENEELTAKVNQLTRQIALQSVKPMPATTSVEKPAPEIVRTANVRPITPTTQHSTTITMWRGNETPLASIRPMTVQSGRSSSMMSGNQTIGISIETAGSTTNVNSESISSNQCGTSSTIVATVPPLGSTPLNLTEESNNETFLNEDHNNCQSAAIVSQTIALVSPRIETNHGVDTSQTVTTDEVHLNVTEMENEIPTSLINMQPASSSVAVSTSQSNLKRNRDTEVLETPQTKKIRSLDIDKKSSKFINEVEYQVPTSSQRDQEDDVTEIEETEIIDMQTKDLAIQESYLEDQNSADGNSTQHDSKASSSDTVVNPSSSETWFVEAKSEVDVNDDTQNNVLPTTTINLNDIIAVNENVEESNNDPEIIAASNKSEIGQTPQISKPE